MQAALRRGRRPTFEAVEVSVYASSESELMLLLSDRIVQKPGSEPYTRFETYARAPTSNILTLADVAETHGTILYFILKLLSGSEL